MKIKYEFVTETVEIEVSDDWGNLVIDMDRLEFNNNQTETRRHISYDALDFDGDAMNTLDTGITAMEENDALYRAMAKLSQTQQQMLYSHFFAGLSYTEIAHRMGNSPQAVRQAIERAKKKIQKIFVPPV